jgi:hypothetical protein
VTIAVLPYGTTVEDIASVPQMAPGLVSAGLGSVPIAQTYLDTSQGNRVNENLYDGNLPSVLLRNGEVPPAVWDKVERRADSAPAQIHPGLLGQTLADAGLRVTASPVSGLAQLIAVDRDGRVEFSDKADDTPGVSLVRAHVDQLSELIDQAGPDGMVIALTAANGAAQQLLPAGIAGAGFDGDLTSSSTRTDGVVLTTDIGPTVLDHLGLDVPDAMNGSVIESEDNRDPAGVAELQGRLDHRPDRDDTVLLPLLIWLLLTALASAIWRGRAARPALRLLAQACAWAPLILLPLAGLDASTPASALAVGLGAPTLALIADRLFSPCGALAVACFATVTGYAIDVIAGSPLTALSILGPNPGAGVRFFGIGNELEAILTTLTLIGTGAALQVLAPTAAPRRAALTFVGVAIVAIAAFAPGRFGADVGAAIVLGVGAATAAVLALGLSRGKAVAAVIGGGALALAGLVAVDLISGGAHLTRSVLSAGSTGDVLDVFDRRLRLMTRTFTHPVYPELLVVAIALLVVGFVRGNRIVGWFGDRRWALDGYLGAVVGVLVGTVANDSGSVLLVIGVIYLAVVAGFYWATHLSNKP